MMSDFLKRYAAGVWWIALVVLAAGPVYGQVQCVANSLVIPPVRPSEVTAQVGPIQLSCWGGTPTPAGQPVPTVDVRVTLSADYTGRKTGEWTESLLLIDEPSAQSQVPCTTDSSLCGWTGGSAGPNVFQGKLLNSNTVVFYGVPLDPPAPDGVRWLRIENLRANASMVPVSTSYIPSSITADLSVTGVTVANDSALTVAYVTPSMQAEVRNAANDAAASSATGVELSSCTPVTKQRLANLRFREKFGTALLKPNWTYDAVTGARGTPDPQAVLGIIYNTESGFYNPAFPATNHLNVAGLADSGTRLQATFRGLPPGATLYVSTVAVTYTNGVPTPNSASQEVASLTASGTGPYAPVAATETLDGLPAAAIPITDGTATAVWEILQSNPGRNSNIDFPVWITFPGSSDGLGTAQVTMQFGPVSSETAASETAPRPRFADQSTTLPLFTAPATCSSAPYLVTTSPAFLPITVDGQSYTSPKAFAWQAGSTHTISAGTAVTTAPGTRQFLTGWSDAGAATHIVTAPAGNATYTANYKLQYLLNAVVTPTGCGSLTSSPVSADWFYDGNQQVQVTATPAGPCSFTGFSGDVVSSQTSVSVSMTQPRNLTASFAAATGGTRPLSVSPAAGAGSAQTFTAAFQGAQGANTLAWVQMLVAAAPDGGGQPFCFLHYDVQADAFWVYSDLDGYFHGPVKAQAPSDTLQGTACALDTFRSGAAANGSQLSVTLRVLFKAAGAKNVYLRASDYFGADSGWVQSGAWTMQAMAAPSMTVSPSSGVSAFPYFQASYTLDEFGHQGAAPRGWLQFLVAADPSGGGQPFCFVHYDRAGGGLWMYSSDVGFFLGPVAPGTASTALDSTACSVNTAAASAGEGPAFSSTLNLPLTLKAPMSGAKKLFMRTLDPLQRDSGWVEVGTYQVP